MKNLQSDPAQLEEDEASAIAAPRATEPHSITAHSARIHRQAVGPVSALVVAICCTGLIGFAIYTAFGAQSNGDLLLIVIPVLGAIFFSIPAGRAWVAFVRAMRGS